MRFNNRSNICSKLFFLCIVLGKIKLKVEIKLKDFAPEAVRIKEKLLLRSFTFNSAYFTILMPNVFSRPNHSFKSITFCSINPTALLCCSKINHFQRNQCHKITYLELLLFTNVFIPQKEEGRQFQKSNPTNPSCLLSLTYKCV